MGREIIIQARIKDNVIYEDYVCGRDDATQYIATLVNDYCNDYNSESSEIIYNFSSSEQMNNLDSVINHLQEFKDRDNHAIEKAKACLEDLKCARRNTAALKDFDDFTERYEEVEQWIENNDWSRAGSLIDMIVKAKEELETYFKNMPITKFGVTSSVGVVAIIWSE